mmetsp:Transcript_23214/g.58898  ORF Transcript_23214/g.58898 Transcript_23214/m.58898 type:complete len:502 (-) Transcript_23214:86-1591(-)
MPGIDWRTLAPTASRFERIAFIDSDETDTQVALWRDVQAREIVLAFRGTEQTRWRDLLVDASITQDPWALGGGAALCLAHDSLGVRPRAHAGFLRSWAAVSPRVAEMLLLAVGEGHLIGSRKGGGSGGGNSGGGGEGWRLFCTGHSLGGGLATLAALEIAQSALPLASVSLYSYGAPRVGNRELSALIDRYIPEAFRVVNGRDGVTRMPRGVGSAVADGALGGILDYSHAGRAVFVDEREPICRVAGVAHAPTSSYGPKVAQTPGSDWKYPRRSKYDENMEVAAKQPESNSISGAAIDFELEEDIGYEFEEDFDSEGLVDKFQNPFDSENLENSSLSNSEREFTMADAPFPDPLDELERHAWEEMANANATSNDTYSPPLGSRGRLRAVAGAAARAGWREAVRIGKVIRSGGLAGRERRGFAAAALRSVKRRVVSAAKVAGLDLRRRPTLGETAKLLGVELSADFVKEELAMLAAIRSGQAVAHHLEPSYLEALSKASSVQ